MHLVDPSHGIFGTVPLVGATIPLAVGAALSAKLRGTEQVAVAFLEMVRPTRGTSMSR